MDLEQFARQRLRVTGAASTSGWLPALCPLHEESRPSFGINLFSGVWNCFVCGTGSLHQLLSRLGVPPERHTELYASLHDRREKAYTPAVECVTIDELVTARFQRVTPEEVSPKFTESTIRRFEVGYDPLTGRVVWPIRDNLGRLIALSGRAITPEAERRGKYKVYKDELQELHPGYEPQHRSHFFNIDKVFPTFYVGTNLPIILVEGFKACAWCVQSGYPFTLALMGSRITQQQLAFLLRLTLPEIVLFLDNNNAGVRGTEATGRLLLPHTPVFVAQYPDGREQPDDLSGEELTRALEHKTEYVAWRTEMTVRRRSHAAEANTYVDRSSGGAPKSAYFDPPTEGKARIRIIKGNYSQNIWDQNRKMVTLVENRSFYMRHRHYMQSKKMYMVCSAGPDAQKPEPCIGCDLNNQWVETQRGRSRVVTTRQEFMYTIIYLAYFHKVQQVGRTGQPYTEYILCKLDPRGGGRCEFCDQGVERAWGRRLHWSLPKTHYQALTNYADAVVESKCHCGGDIYLVAYVCANCGQMLVDAGVERLTEREMEQHGNSQKVCPQCNFVGYPMEEVECGRMDDQGQRTVCEGAHPISLFEVDLYVLKTRTDPPSLQFERTAPSLTPYAPPTVDTWPIDLERLSKPMDMAALSIPPSMAEQASAYGVEAAPPAQPLPTTPNVQY